MPMRLYGISVTPGQPLTGIQWRDAVASPVNNSVCRTMSTLNDDL